MAEGKLVYEGQKIIKTTQSIALSSTGLIPKGTYDIVTNTTTKIQVLDPPTTWTDLFANNINVNDFYSDGINYRFNNGNVAAAEVQTLFRKDKYD